MGFYLKNNIPLHKNDMIALRIVGSGFIERYIIKDFLQRAKPRKKAFSEIMPGIIEDAHKMANPSYEDEDYFRFSYDAEKFDNGISSPSLWRFIMDF